MTGDCWLSNPSVYNPKHSMYGILQGGHLPISKCNPCRLWPYKWITWVITLLMQIIATENTTDFPPKVAFWKGNPLISGKSRLVKYYNLARCMVYLPSRERSHIPPWEKENHQLKKCRLGWDMLYVSFLEGTYIWFIFYGKCR